MKMLAIFFFIVDLIRDAVLTKVRRKGSSKPVMNLQYVQDVTGEAQGFSGWSIRGILSPTGKM